jgi:hypothetical protein
MANTCTLVQVLAIGTGAILDLTSRAGYRAKEMPSLCSYFAFGHHSETLGDQCLGLCELRWIASAAVIKKVVLMVARVTRADRFESLGALNGIAR